MLSERNESQICLDCCPGEKTEAQQLWSPQHPNQNIGNIPNAELACKGIVLNRTLFTRRKTLQSFLHSWHFMARTVCFRFSSLKINITSVFLHSSSWGTSLSQPQMVLVCKNPWVMNAVILLRWQDSFN